mmetsp:Transcript_5618/g.9782  ORF Transcript_5618/g.9782 Transcript_5618/m.9782 type:complete len:203 (+) Transcript_5618:1-609(+)
MHSAPAQQWHTQSPSISRCGFRPVLLQGGPRGCRGLVPQVSVQRLSSCKASTGDPRVKDGVHKAGYILRVHSPTELETYTKQPPTSSKLSILMAKSSHCRPCMKFAATYNLLAERFSDAIVMEVMGDENPTTRKWMMDMKIKVTPSFFLYRDGKLLTTLTGTTRSALRDAILEQLGPSEKGRDWVEPPVSVGSDSDSDSDDE